MPVPDNTTDTGQVPADAARDVDALMPEVYAELRALAETVLQRCQPIDATSTTSLVHDVYLRLTQRGMRFENRAHFMRVAARAMRYVLIDRARRGGAAKRGGQQPAIRFDETIALTAGDGDVLALDEALAKLATFDERKSQIIELRFFGGLSLEETAEVMGISPATIKREWTLARAWLCRELGEGETSSTG